MTKPVNLAIRDHILAALRDVYPGLVSTRDLCTRLGVKRYDEVGMRVYRILHGMAAPSRVHPVKVERVHLAGVQDAYWRLPEQPWDDPAADALGDVLAVMEKAFQEGQGPL